MLEEEELNNLRLKALCCCKKSGSQKRAPGRFGRQERSQGCLNQVPCMTLAPAAHDAYSGVESDQHIEATTGGNLKCSSWIQPNPKLTRQGM